jgi:hypothetical protein
LSEVQVCLSLLVVALSTTWYEISDAMLAAMDPIARDGVIELIGGRSRQ